MKKALLVVGFGTTYKDTIEKTIAQCERKMRENHPDRKFFRAFTSPTIIKKLRAKGFEIDNSKEALEKIIEQGYDDIIVQPLYMIHGFEYDRLDNLLNEYKDRFSSITLGRSLIENDDDRKEIVEIIIDTYKDMMKDRTTIFVGHGTEHEVDEVYDFCEEKFRNSGFDVHIGTMDGRRNAEDIIADMEKRGVKNVNLIPFLFVSGVHAREDIAGDGEGSWKTKLIEKGIDVDFTFKSLGEIEKIQDKFTRHLDEGKKIK